MRPRDYVVAAVIILGFLVAWFLIIAALMNLVAPGLAFSLAVIIGFIVYLFLKRQKPKL